MLLLLLQFGLLAQLPVQLAAVSEHEVLKTAAEALISVFPAAQYVRCAQQVAGLKKQVLLVTVLSISTQTLLMPDWLILELRTLSAFVLLCLTGRRCCGSGVIAAAQDTQSFITPQHNRDS
jgi:hypothetical protein